MRKQKHILVLIFLLGSVLLRVPVCFGESSQISLPLPSVTQPQDSQQSDKISTTSVSTTSQQESQNPEQQKTFGERMVEFIRKLLGEEPKKIDENLVRDKM